MSLAEARNRCREIRELVDDGIDPKAELERRRLAEVDERRVQGHRKRAEQATALYEDLARVYLESVKNRTTRTEIARLLEKDARPVLKRSKFPSAKTWSRTEKRFLASGVRWAGRQAL